MLAAEVPRKSTRAVSISEGVPIVFVVDDDVSIRESLELLIRSAGWQAKTCATAQEFLRHPRPRGASCIILDVNLPDLNGLDLQKLVATKQAEMPIIFITGYEDVPTVVKAMKAGAVEFLPKPLTEAEVVAAIEDALERSRCAVADAEELRALKERYGSLTPREREVMHLVASGLLNKQIAFELGITEITVKAHRGQVMHKMQAHSLAGLVTMAASLRPSGS